MKPRKFWITDNRCTGEYKVFESELSLYEEVAHNDDIINVREVNPELDAAIKKIVKLFQEATPFAVHVSVCDNHDGQKFQELADKWIDNRDKALAAYRKAME